MRQSLGKVEGKREAVGNGWGKDDWRSGEDWMVGGGRWVGKGKGRRGRGKGRGERG